MFVRLDICVCVERNVEAVLNQFGYRAGANINYAAAGACERTARAGFIELFHCGPQHNNDNSSNKYVRGRAI